MLMSPTPPLRHHAMHGGGPKTTRLPDLKSDSDPQRKLLDARVRARANPLSVGVWHFTLRFVLPRVGLATPSRRPKGCGVQSPLGPKVYPKSKGSYPLPPPSRSQADATTSILRQRSSSSRNQARILAPVSPRQECMDRCPPTSSYPQAGNACSSFHIASRSLHRIYYVSHCVLLKCVFLFCSKSLRGGGAPLAPADRGIA